jgi:hypothetical protein
MVAEEHSQCELTSRSENCTFMTFGSWRGGVFSGSHARFIALARMLPIPDEGILWDHPSTTGDQPAAGVMFHQWVSCLASVLIRAYIRCTTLQSCARMSRGLITSALVKLAIETRPYFAQSAGMAFFICIASGLGRTTLIFTSFQQKECSQGIRIR